MKRWFMAGALVAVIALIISVTLPLTAMGAGKGNERKGKYFYKKVCKQCHVEDGAAMDLTPMSKTSAQWEAYFKEGKHAEGALTDIEKEENLLHIKTFLINHAADSDQPETCG